MLVLLISFFNTWFTLASLLIWRRIITEGEKEEKIKGSKNVYSENDEMCLFEGTAQEILIRVFTFMNTPRCEF